MIWPTLHSLSATTFRQPGICRALRVTCLVHQVLVHQVMIIHRKSHSGSNFDIGNHSDVVCGYKNYVVLAEVLGLLRAKKTAFSSR